MITIDQLLESVELNFEPRFVTKDLDGIVNICSEKPHRRSMDWNCYAYATIYEGLKLSEFDGKNWTECIYEVPRKTIGKIERLETNADYMQLSSSSMNKNQDVADTIMEKINELVDAVNELKGSNNE